MTEREKIITLAVETGIAIQDDKLAAICEPPTWNQMEAFYHAAQKEAFEQSAQVLDNGYFLTDTSPEKKWAEQVAYKIRQLIKE